MMNRLSTEFWTAFSRKHYLFRTLGSVFWPPFSVAAGQPHGTARAIYFPSHQLGSMVNSPWPRNATSVSSMRSR